MKKAVILYSGGKDSHFALYTALKKGYSVPFLINLEPIPHSRGYIYFNNPYSKKIIELHSKLMNIEILYFKIDERKYLIFKNDISAFISELVGWVEGKIGDFTFFFTWDKDDIKSEPNHKKQYRLITDFFNKTNREYLFPFIDKYFKDLTKSYSKVGIKPICVGISRDKNKFKSFLGRTMDLKFIDDMGKENKKLKPRFRITKPDIQSLVIESPLFNGKKITPVSFKNITSKENLFIKIDRYKIY
ncbi:MAG TPA: hypothetical protein PK103_03820 [Elusimicrobiales bacterium]|nr:hypothetical protein [Elusimicrobiales bacterium]